MIARVPFEAAVGVDGQDLARAELPAPHLPVTFERDGADLGHAGNEPIRGDRVAKRPKPVAIERSADHPPVGEDDAGRPVPGLDEA